jgi:putative addiction module killer protein
VAAKSWVPNGRIESTRRAGEECAHGGHLPHAVDDGGDRLQTGLLGDWDSVGEGVYELRIDFGPGYRVYFGQEGKLLILLLCGGDKSTQTKDIKRAHAYWKDYQTRSSKPPVQRGGPPEKRGRNRRIH